MTESYKVVGTRPNRPDAADKVTGRAVFGSDVKVSGLLQGKLLRSPHAHARIKSIDTSKAEALPGVLAVVTAKDVPARQAAGAEGPDQDLRFFLDNFIASDKVLHVGHPVAAVAAVDRFVADEALELIDVEYEVLPPVLDVREAMRPGAPLLHEDLTTLSLGQPTGETSNVATHFRTLRGDPERGFAEADVTVEREFRTLTVHQGYLESHVTTAVPSGDGHLTVYSSTQGAFMSRGEVTRFLAYPEAKVNVIPTEVGGGFGGKGNTHLEPVAALLALKSGRPVRLAMGRAETFEGTGPTPGSYMKVKLGATKDGRITALAAELMFEAGAYPGSAVGAAARCMVAPYDIPNGQVDGYDVVVNKPRASAYRAPGAPQGAFAMESVVDEVCQRLGMDPLEFRLKNAGREGTRALDGTVLGPVAFAETIRAAMEHPHYSAPLGGPNRGRGVAAGWWGNGAGPSSVVMSVNSDGTVNLASGSVDLQGTRTTIAMQAAEILGLALDRIHPVVSDTDSIGFTDVSGGSRTTHATGIAAIQVANDVLRQMTARAARLWDVDTASVAYASGTFTTSADPSRSMTFAELAGRLMRTGGPVSASASVNARGAGSALGVHIADVELDPGTGQVRVLRYTACQDVGKAVHPGLVEGQIQGGVVQGIGWALWEGYRYDRDGRMLNHSFLDYKLATALDIPPIDTVLVEAVPNPGHPFGVRGVGETPIVPPLATIANAVARATGTRITELPLSAAVVLEKMGVIG